MQKPKSVVIHQTIGDRMSQDSNLNLIEQAKTGNPQSFAQLRKKARALIDRPQSKKSTAPKLQIAEQIIREMSARQQKILQLVCWEQHSTAEVAASLGIKNEDVYKAVTMFRRQFRRIMKGPKQ